MQLTAMETILIIVAVAAATVLTRALPFFLFPENKKLPKIVEYLGKTLPPAMMGLLVVYSLKSVSILKAPFGAPELLGVLSVCLLHLWKKNTLLSIGGGTAVYMALLYFVF